MCEVFANPKAQGSGIATCIPQAGRCPRGCNSCFFQENSFYIPMDKLPYIPNMDDVKGQIVRCNDGNDSFHKLKDVLKITSMYPDVFFNTSYPVADKFLRNKKLLPVVVTVNPGGKEDMTDTDFHKLEYSPNIMFVRFRKNLWNDKLCHECCSYYRDLGIPVVLTYMRYNTIDEIPEEYRRYYQESKHLLNTYYALSKEAAYSHFRQFQVDFENVFYCGSRHSSLCKTCGNCIREYYATKERLSGKS